MAKFLKGINGAYSGKVGNVVGSNWRNVDYVRSLPKPSKKAPTAAQIAQRDRFALAVAFLSPIKDLLNLGYSDKLQGRSTGYNKAMQYVINKGVVGEGDDLRIDYEQVSIARGGLSNLMGVQWEETEPREITVSWVVELNRFTAFADDSVILLMYNAEKAFFSILESNVREDASFSFSLPDVYSGDQVMGWVFTGHRDGIKTSNSTYLGVIEVS